MIVAEASMQIIEQRIPRAGSGCAVEHQPFSIAELPEQSKHGKYIVAMVRDADQQPPRKIRQSMERGVIGTIDAIQ